MTKNLLEEIERACQQAEEPKHKNFIKKLQEGRKRLREKHKKEWTEMVKEAMK